MTLLFLYSFSKLIALSSECASDLHLIILVSEECSS